MKGKLIRIGIAGFLFLSVMGASLFNVLPVSASTITSTVSANSDDSSGMSGAYSINNGAEGFGSVGVAYSSGLIFRGITLSSSVTITSAYLTFTSNNTRTVAVNSTIEAQVSASPLTYGATEDFTARSYLGTTVSWNFTSTTWTAGDTYNSPNISSIITALLIANGSYVSGVMAFEVLGSSSDSWMQGVAYESNPAQTVTLTINYTTGAVTDLYWVGGSGNWSDATNHWAITSGGLPAVGDEPSATTNVHFDANSFSENGQYVTQDVTGSCASMDWSGISYTGISFNVADNDCNVYGSFAGNSNLTVQTGNFYTDHKQYLNFCSTSTGNTINLGGVTIVSEHGGEIRFNGVGGGWTLTSGFGLNKPSYYPGGNNGVIEVSNGTFNTGNYNITGTDSVQSGYGTFIQTGGICNLGSSSIYLEYWTYAGGTLNAGTSTLYMKTGSGFYGGGATYNNVNYTDTSTSWLTSYFNITGANTFVNLTMVSGNIAGTTIIAADQIVTGTLTLTGYNSSTKRMSVGSSVAGTQRQITAAAVSITNCNISDMVGVGGSSWNISAGLNSDYGNNIGITFTVGQNDYWVGNSNTWSNLADWASTSGGTGGTGRIPLVQDTAVFDGYSFTTSGRTVTMDVPDIGSVDTSAVAQTGTTFSGSTINIHGNMNMGNVTYSVSTTNFVGGTNNTVVSTNALTTNLYISKIPTTASVTLSGDTTVIGTVYLSSGLLDLGNHNLTASYFDSSTTTYARTLTMGSGLFTLNGTSATTKWNVASTNLTINCNTSTIVLTNSTTNGQTFTGAGLTYYNLRITGGAYVLTFGNGIIIHELYVVRGISSCPSLAGNVTLTINAGINGGFVSPVNGTVFLNIADVDISQSSGIDILDYLNFTSGSNTCTASGGATFYAGADSTGSPQTGWSFTSPILPLVSTISAAPGTITATLSGQVTAMGGYVTLYAGFLYGTNPLFVTYSTSSLSAPITTTTPYTANITGLIGGTTYYYVAFVGDGSTILSYGTPASFTTGGVGAPTVTTMTYSNLTQTSATINLSWNIGNQTSVIVQFQWGLTTAYGQVTNPQTETTATGAWSYALDSTNGIILNGGVTYHYQAILSYDGPGSPVYGIDKTFDTLALDKPIAPSAPGSITLGKGNTYQKMLGPTLSGALDACGRAFGTDGKGFGGGLTFIVCCLILIFCSARGYPVAGLAIGYPLQLASAWVGLWDWAFVGVVTFILALIWVKATWLDK